jgi:acyl-coenzyme A thioesterase PaaI-like protein
MTSGLLAPGRPAAAPGADDDLRARVHPRCIVCSASNPRGLGLRVTALADGAVRAECDCDQAFEGYPGALHGGMVCALMDGAMANCLFHAGLVARTASISVRFRHGVRTGAPATIVARIHRSRGRFHELRAELSQDGDVRAEATARFLEDGG